jgi:hypothetical protein
MKTDPSHIAILLVHSTSYRFVGGDAGYKYKARIES